MNKTVLLAGAIALAGPCLVSPALAQSASFAQAEVDAARAAAQANRNREAADRFAAAIAADPALRSDVLRELADQLTYSDRAAQAVPLYREVLARPGLAAEERERAMRGLALALAWSGQHRAAIQAYDALLARYPADRDALAMRGKVKGWRRDYGGAEADLKAALALEPTNADTIRALAEVQSYAGHQRDALATLAQLPGGTDGESARLIARTQLWAGRPQAARESLAQVMVLDPGDSAAAAINADARTATRPLTEVSVRYSDQSDASNFYALSGWQTVWPSESVALGLGYDGFFFRPSAGDDLDVHRPGVSARVRLSDTAEWNGQFGLAIVDDSEADGDRTAATWNTWGTLIPSDRLRFDAGINRSILDNRISNRLGIHADTVSGSVDIGSDAAWKLSLRGSWSDFSDDNERLWGQAEVRRRFAWSPNAFLGLRYTRFGFDRPTGGGYFSPTDLASVDATAQVWGRAGKFWYDLEGAVGREDNSGEKRTTYSVEGKLTYVISPRVEVQAFVHSFSSRTGAPGGFARTTTGLMLRSRL